MGSSITSLLRGELEPVLADADGVRALYLFGSALSLAAPRDIDLVLVYGPPLTPLGARALGEPIAAAVKRSHEIPAHILFFSEREAREPAFFDLHPELIVSRDGLTCGAES